MRNILIASAFALVGLSAAAPSQAMPFAPAEKAPSAFTLTAGGCGPGLHRGPMADADQTAAHMRILTPTGTAGGAMACASATDRSD